MPVLVQDIVSAVITELSQVPGVATQIYASGRIQQFVQNAFNMEFDDYFWPSYLAYVQAGVDGSTGSLTNDLVGPLGGIQTYEDIQAVWPAGSNRRLKDLPESINPFTITGSTVPLYMIPDYSVPNRPFTVVPVTSSIPLVVRGLQRPNMPLDLTDPVYLDMLLLQYDACWMYAVDDGTIPAQVNKFQVLAQKRRTQVKAALSQHPLPLDPRGRYQDQHMGGYFVLDEDPLA